MCKNTWLSGVATNTRQRDLEWQRKVDDYHLYYKQLSPCETQPGRREPDMPLHVCAIDGQGLLYVTRVITCNTPAPRRWTSSRFSRSIRDCRRFRRSNSCRSVLLVIRIKPQPGVGRSSTGSGSLQVVCSAHTRTMQYSYIWVICVRAEIVFFFKGKHHTLLLRTLSGSSTSTPSQTGANIPLSRGTADGVVRRLRRGISPEQWRIAIGMLGGARAAGARVQVGVA